MDTNLFTYYIPVTAVDPEASLADKFEMIQNFFSKMAGGSYVGFQNSVFLSERDTADRNFALAYFMRENKCFPRCSYIRHYIPFTILILFRPAGHDCDINTILNFYLQCCSMEMTCESMAIMAATLANGGICPTTGDKVSIVHRH